MIMAKSSVSPLRYPGGKTSITDMLQSVIHNNELRYFQYAEPYAGGCGLALALLYGGYVSHIHINDIDPAIWAFWHSVLNNTDDLIDLIETTPITLDEWKAQRETYLKSDLSNPISVGFSAFFLNRTNRSGIIKGAGPIGGKTQLGNYKIDCRFNREDLKAKIRRVEKYKEQISLYNKDAKEFMNDLDGGSIQNILFVIDPPYYHKGSSLYTNFYRPEDHAAVGQVITNLKSPWLLTYDNCPEISQIYQEFRQHTFNINYSLQNKRKGDELLVTSSDIYIGNEINQYRSVA